jgi:transposase
MIDMLKRHEIQVLRRAGHSQVEVARLAGVSRRSVQRVDTETAVTDIDAAREREARGIGRPAKAEPFRSFVVDVLAREPDLLSVEILRRAKLQGYAGGKTALYDLISALRPTTVRPLVRFEGLAGEFSQHDFGHVDVRFLDETKKRIHFFASRLKYSRWVEVTIVSDECAETLVRTLVDHFALIGGIPLLAVFDRPKTIALKWSKDGQVTEWNALFAGVALDLGLGIEVCWPSSPRQKGSIENLVGWVKGSFFKQRRFLDDADLLTQLAEWRTEVNTERPCRATGVIPAVRLEEERPRLRPLKVAPERLALRVPIVVGPTAVVVHDTHPYSMPPDAIGIPGTLFLYRDRVRIVAGRFEASHQRQFEPGAPSTLPEHRALLVAAVSGKRAKRYLQREHLLDLGPPALAYLTELTHRRPRIWLRDVDRLHGLLATYGDAALRAPFARGLAEQAIGAEYIAHFLAETVTSPAPIEGIVPVGPSLDRRSWGILAGRSRVRRSFHSTCRRQMLPLRRAEAGSRPPQAPGGPERSEGPGRGRARRYPLTPTEGDHDALRTGARCLAETLALGQHAPGVAGADTPRGAGGVELPRLSRVAHLGRNRAPAADAVASPGAPRTLSISEDDRRFQLYPPVDAPSLAPRISTRAGVCDRGALPDSGGKTWTRQNASRGRDCVSGDSEWLRCALRDRRRTD